MPKPTRQIPVLSRQLGGRVSPAFALMVVDVQERIFDPKARWNTIRNKALGSGSLHKLLSVLVDNLGWMAPANVPVVTVELVSDGKEPGWGSTHPQIFQAVDGDPFIFPKTTPGAFEMKSSGLLKEYLGHRGVQTLVVVGANSDACVQATAMGALKADFDVLLPDDAHLNIWDGRPTRKDTDALFRYMTEFPGWGKGRLFRCAKLSDLRSWQQPQEEFWEYPRVSNLSR